MFSISYQFKLVDFLAVMAVVFFVFIFYFYRKRKKVYNDNIDRRFIKDRWQKIEELLNLKHEMNCKLAVIEADKILEDVLKSMYFSGETMAERLKVAGYKFPKLRHVWWAHKVRNMCVHDLRYVLKFSEAKKVISLFKDALEELDVL
ncbi:MAG: hypothetical protein WCT18_00565 [Patescibacteria group bacterium]